MEKWVPAGRSSRSSRPFRCYSFTSVTSITRFVGYINTYLLYIQCLSCIACDHPAPPAGSVHQLCTAPSLSTHHFCSETTRVLWSSRGVSLDFRHFSVLLFSRVGFSTTPNPSLLHLHAPIGPISRGHIIPICVAINWTPDPSVAFASCIRSAYVTSSQESSTSISLYPERICTPCQPNAPIHTRLPFLNISVILLPRRPHSALRLPQLLNPNAYTNIRFNAVDRCSQHYLLIRSCSPSFFTHRIILAWVGSVWEGRGVGCTKIVLQDCSSAFS